MAVEPLVSETKIITGEDLAAMGDIGPYELVEGRLVPMTPTGDEHGGYQGNFYYAIRSFANAHKLGKVRVGEIGIYTRRNPDTVRAADVYFVSNERYAQKKVPQFFGCRARSRGRSTFAK